jgi:hypothetical protein
LKKFVFSGRSFEAEETFCDCIPLLNKNFLWIRFVKSISASQQSALTFGGYAQQKIKASPQRKGETKEQRPKV